MSKNTTYLLGILVTIIVGCLLYHHFCCGECCIDKSANATIPATDLGETSFKLQGAGIDYQSVGSFNFLNDNLKPISPINDSINIGIANLKIAMAASQQKLTITGYALSTEKNKSPFENLGLARANEVKNYFLAKGIPSSAVAIKGEIIDNLNQKDNTIYGPVNFTLTNVAKDAPVEDWKALRDKINANPLTLYFNTGRSDIDLSDGDRKKVTDIVRYLDNVKDAGLTVTGFTDNTGDFAKNLVLGKNRADFATKYLTSNGIDSTKIITSSKGQDSPIASNDTEDGKAKNRRTEVKIK